MYVPQTPLWNHRPSQGEDITTIISFHLPTYYYLPTNIQPHSTTIPQNPKTHRNRSQQRIHERETIARARAHTHNVHNKNATSSLMLLLHIHIFPSQSYNCKLQSREQQKGYVAYKLASCCQLLFSPFLLSSPPNASQIKQPFLLPLLFRVLPMSPLAFIVASTTTTTTTTTGTSNSGI
jgi:hypothetical protein